MWSNCLAFSWRAIIDHLMTHDKTTFRDLMSKPQTLLPLRLSLERVTITTPSPPISELIQLLKLMYVIGNKVLIHLK